MPIISFSYSPVYFLRFILFLKYVGSVCHVCAGALSTLKRVSLEIGRW